MRPSRDPLIPGENRLLTVRPHPLCLLKPGLLTLVSAAILLGLSLTLGIYWLLLFGLFPAGLLAWEILARRSLLYLVTDLGVWRLDGLVDRASAGTPYAAISAVHCVRRFPGAFLGYGRVVVDTTEHEGAVAFDWVPEPGKVKSAILSLRELDAERIRGMITASEFAERQRTLLERL